jgi:antirestriction protein ArdC
MTPPTSTQRSDLYTRVTERVVADLERGGARPWLKPWTSRSPRITRPRRRRRVDSTSGSKCGSGG